MALNVIFKFFFNVALIKRHLGVKHYKIMEAKIYFVYLKEEYSFQNFYLLQKLVLKNPG